MLPSPIAIDTVDVLPLVAVAETCCISAAGPPGGSAVERAHSGACCIVGARSWYNAQGWYSEGRLRANGPSTHLCCSYQRRCVNTIAAGMGAPAHTHAVSGPAARGPEVRAVVDAC